MLQPLPPIRPATIFPANAQYAALADQPAAFSLSGMLNSVDYIAFLTLLMASITFVGSGVFCYLQPNNPTVKAVKKNVFAFFKCGKKQSNDNNQYSLVENHPELENRFRG